MPYTWWDFGVTSEEYGIETTDDPADGHTVFENFGDARAALIRSLTARRDACAEAVRETRALRKRDVR